MNFVKGLLDPAVLFLCKKKFHYKWNFVSQQDLQKVQAKLSDLSSLTVDQVGQYNQRILWLMYAKVKKAWMFPCIKVGQFSIGLLSARFHANSGDCNQKRNSEQL